MKKIISILLITQLFGSLSWAGHKEFHSFGQFAMHTMEQTWSEINDCGLLRWDAHDPRLPHPQVPADEAVVSSRALVLAYYYERLGHGNSLEFKNPNGGMKHSVRYTSDDISFVTPYAGTVARANRFYTVEGPHYNFYCGTLKLESAELFSKCVNERFVRVITDQLCRFSAPRF
jgi:hypothetical protein